MTSLPPVQKRVPDGVSFWNEFAALTAETKSVSLGQGFPDEAPMFLRRLCAEAVVDGDRNQYTRSAGHPPLVAALAARYSARHGATLDAMQNVLVTVGGAEAFYACAQAFLGPGDEALVLSPFFDFYRSQIEMAGGVVVGVPLQPPPSSSSNEAANDWTVTRDALDAAATPRTRLIVVNTPLNPLGKVFTAAELRVVAEFARTHSLLIVADEVYEEWALEPAAAPHVSIAALGDDAAQRTLTIGSAGKLLSVTGWKVGWAVSSNASLVAACARVHQYIMFTLATPLQHAVAEALAAANAAAPASTYAGAAVDAPSAVDYWHAYRRELLLHRDLLCAALRRCAYFDIITPRGGYFIVARLTDAWQPDKDCFDFCRWLARAHRVSAIPVLPSFTSAHAALGRRLVRFCFAKRRATIDEAIERLSELP